MTASTSLSLAATIALGGLSSDAYSLPQLDVPYVPTPEPVVETMLDMAQVDENDLLYDLGSGDGRIVIAAAGRGARGVGVELNPRRVEEARRNAVEAGVEDVVTFIQGDLFEVDFSEATVLSLYLLPDVNLQLRPRILSELRPGSRVVSHAFDMGEWEPDRMDTVDHALVYHWVVPADVAGSWRWEGAAGESQRLELSQQFQQVGGHMEISGQRLPIREAELDGTQLRFSYVHPEQGLQQVQAQVEGATLVGQSGSETLTARGERWRAQREDIAARDSGHRD